MEQISSITTEKPAYKVTFRKIARAAAAETRVHKKLAIITFVFFGVAMLLFVFNGKCYFIHPYSGGYNGYGEPYFEMSGWGAAFAIMGALTSIFAALNVFRDTNNQQLCDVAMALPIKATERFFSKLLCLFYIQTAPLIVSVLGGNMISVLIGAINGFKPGPETFELIFAVFFAIFAGSLFIMSITVLSACCCGAIAESAYFSLILGFIINFLPQFFISNVIGTSSGFYDSDWMFGLFNKWGNIDVTYWGFLYLFQDSNAAVISHAAVGSGISLAVMLLSIFIYRKRDARTVGTPIASKVFFELIIAGGCVTIFSIAVMSEGFGWGILCAGVAYIVINIIVSRAKINVLSFLKWAGKFALTTAVFMGITVIAIKTGGFGFYKTRPDIEYYDRASVAMSISHSYSNMVATRLYTDELTTEQAEQFLKVCDRHLQKGLAHVNPFDVMFDSYRSMGRATIGVDGWHEYYTRPSPKFLFDERWNGNGGGYVYKLDYVQGLKIDYADSEALARELKQLDFVHEERYND